MKQEIIKKCCELFDVHPRDLTGPARFAWLIRARFALYKALQMRGWSYTEIGRLVGGRDHSSIIHGVRRAEYMMERDPCYADAVHELVGLKPMAIRWKTPPEPESELKDFLYD